MFKDTDIELKGKTYVEKNNNKKNKQLLFYVLLIKNYYFLNHVFIF